MIMTLTERQGFEKAWRHLKKKDEIAIKKVERRFVSRDGFSYNFTCKVYDLYDAYKTQIPHIATILEEYLDNPMFTRLFNTSFSKAQVYSVLMDMQFLGTLMCNGLLRRTVHLNRKSKQQLKIRIYIAILNYDSYKKHSK